MLRPLVHFLVLGGLLFLAVRYGSDEWTHASNEPLREPIAISDARIARLSDEWVARYGSLPSPAERRAIVEAEINDEILHREALRLGMHLADPVVSLRLVQNMRFLGGPDQTAAMSDDALFRQALELDMARSDLVVRRRLISQMQAILETAAVPPTPQETRDYVRRHPGRFSTSPRYEISYRFEALIEGGQSSTPVRRGVFSAKKLAQSFGAQGADRIVDLPPGEWSGPIRRMDGAFWVRLEGVVPARMIEFEYVQKRAQQAVMRERREQALRRELERLRTIYLTDGVGATRDPLPIARDIYPSLLTRLPI
jgi:hypothetical protein